MESITHDQWVSKGLPKEGEVRVVYNSNIRDTYVQKIRDVEIEQTTGDTFSALGAGVELGANLVSIYDDRYNEAPSGFVVVTVQTISLKDDRPVYTKTKQYVMPNSSIVCINVNYANDEDVTA